MALSHVLYSQAGINTQNVQPGVVLEISNQNSPPNAKKGVLLPRLTTAQRDSIPNPQVGLIIYNTDENALNFYIGKTVAWRSLKGTESEN